MRNYMGKSCRQSWSEENMAMAIENVMNGKFGLKKAADLFDVRKSTLADRIKKAKQSDLSPAEGAEKSLGSSSTVFSNGQEKEFVAHILLMEERLFGLTCNDVRVLAFQLAEKNNIPNNFNKEKEIAGYDWYQKFMYRHPEISLRSPEKTSIARAKGFNRTSMSKFFHLLEPLIEKYHFSPSDIYNVDETGIMTVPNKPSKIIASKGKKQVGCLSSSERGVLVTAEICMNAAGHFMPTMVIFPRKRINEMLLDGGPPGSFAAYHESGWIQKDIFTTWFKKFVEFSRPTAGKPVLLLLDGHASHTKNIELIELAQKNNVIIVCFPRHCTHRLQPLDVSFMAPLMKYYENEVRNWLRNNP